MVEADEVLLRALRSRLPQGTEGLVPGGDSAQVPASVVREYARAWWAAMGGATETTPEVLERVVGQVAGRVAKGGPHIPYMLEDATGGLADPDRGGLEFGIEIEFDLPEHFTDAQKADARAAIIAGLGEAGLTSQTDVHGYHRAVDEGYTDARDGWRLETDPTVDGELISPILRDTGQTWQDLRTAVGVISEHGGRITKRTSSHVHVSTRQYGTDVRPYEGLRGLFTGHHDELVRLGTNPRADGHRGLKYARPLPERHDGYHGVWDTPSGRNEDALSFKCVQGNGSDHVEFRQPDGSLDEAEIQTNVKIALGLVHAALRMSHVPDWQPPGHEEVGAHAVVVQGVRHAGSGPAVTVFEPDAPEQTARMRTMLDTIFWRAEDREQVMARFAVTPWYGGLGARQADDASSGLLQTAGIPGLEDLESLGSVFLKKMPGGAVFRSTDDAADHGEEATAARLHSMIPGDDAFVTMVAFKRRPYVPNAFGFGGNKRLSAAEFKALLPHLGWSPGQRLVIAHPVEDTPGGLVKWASEMAAEIEAPVLVPASASEYAEEIEVPSERLEGISGLGIFGPPGGSVFDDGDTTVIPGNAWFRLSPEAAADGSAQDDTWPAGTGYVAYTGAQSGQSVTEQVPDSLPAPPASRRGGLDPLSDWMEFSSVSGRRRSGALRAIDNAVAGLPRHPDAQDLAGVLFAVRGWQQTADRTSSRWDAVTQLENAVRDRIRQLSSHSRSSRHASSGHGHQRQSGVQPTASATRGAAMSLIPAGPRPPKVAGYAPASGFETELHKFQVVLPPGEHFKTFGDVEGAIVRLPGLLHITLDSGQNGTVVAEVVTSPARGLTWGQDDGRAERSDVVTAWYDVMQRLENARSGDSLSRVFPTSVGYQVDPVAADFPVRRNLHGSMVVHHTSTSPLTGVLKFLDHVTANMRQESEPVQIAYQDAKAAEQYALWARAGFERWLTMPPRIAGQVRAWDADELTGALALGYTQVAATVRRIGGVGRVLAKDHTAVISRESLGAIRSELGEVPRAFLEDEKDWLTDGFLRSLQKSRTALQRPLPKIMDDTRPQATAGQYWENLLLENPSRVIDQYEALGVRTCYNTLDGNPVGGVPHLEPRVVRLEARALESIHSTPQDVLRTHDTVAHLSVDLYNESRRMRGLSPVGLPLEPESQGQSGYAPPTREQVIGGTGAAASGVAQGVDGQSAESPVAAPAALSPVLADLAGRLPGMPQDERAEELALLPAADVEALASDPALVRDLCESLSAEDFAATVARLMVRIPEGVRQPFSVRREAVNRIAPMLGDPEVAGRLLSRGSRIFVVPRDAELTSVGPFLGLRGTLTVDSRAVDSLRGYLRRGQVGAAEENLLGETTSVPGAGTYDDGYSSVTHELAHAIHTRGLSADDRRFIKEVFDANLALGWAGKWPDGYWYDPVGVNPDPNYSSHNQYEFFAQLSNAYLGTNGGIDPYTEAPRNNGAAWVRENFPQLLPLLERLYGPGAEPPQRGESGRANPFTTTQAENEVWAGFRAFWDQAEGVLRPQPHAEMPPVPATSRGHGSPGVVFGSLSPAGPVGAPAEQPAKKRAARKTTKASPKSTVEEADAAASEAL
ncbi:hypothetical protein O1L68_14915 [Streptomyces lydicus]|nr:hypothetical protein [Streptomyces lydicus]